MREEAERGRKRVEEEGLEKKRKKREVKKLERRMTMIEERERGT